MRALKATARAECARRDAVCVSPRTTSQDLSHMVARVRLATLLLPLFAIARDLSAQGWIEPIQPSPPLGWGVHKLRSAVSVAVHDRVADVTVEEWFQNRGPGLGEGVYHYPLPGEAAFASFSLWQGDVE